MEKIMRHMTFKESVREGFINFFNSSPLPKVLTWAKTLHKRDCLYVYNYMSERKPKVIVEFGTQYGCSACVFVETAKALGLKTKVHSFDIIDERRYKAFTFHKKDLTGKAKEILKLKPDLVYIDVHKYYLIDELIKLCKKEKIDYMLHDTNRIDRCRVDSNEFKNKEVRTTWESYFVEKMTKGKDYHKTKTVEVETVRAGSGLSIVRW